MLPPLIMACATKASARLFPRATLLGRSLKAFPEPVRPQLMLLEANTGPKALGLSEFYNNVIERVGTEDAILIFIHDDVYIHDWHLGARLVEALLHFDVVGVIGSTGVPDGQPGWWHGLDSLGQPRRNDNIVLSGSVNHFDPGQVRPNWYGASPLACDLLDGLFLAVRVASLRSTGLRFDPRFRFHCYDTDFCYSAKAAGLRLGTWPISLTHGSGGSFDQAWGNAARLLEMKWRVAWSQ